MIVGLDLDNTIICYDGVFHAVAKQQGLIPDNIGTSKQAVRDFLREKGRESDWTALQGEVYGNQLRLANPYPAVKACIHHWLQHGIQVRIISHKTRRPFAGPPYDLHESAWDWLEYHGFFKPEVGLCRDHVFLNETKEIKLERVALEECQIFVDDLPEILMHDAYPLSVKPVWFNPTEVSHDTYRGAQTRCWLGVNEYVERHWLGGGDALQPLPGTRNNRLWMNSAENSVIKIYHRDAQDSRDRLHHEWTLSQLAWQGGVRQIPEPLYKHDANAVAHFRRIEGVMCGEKDVHLDSVTQAGEFINALNGLTLSGDELPYASEACMSAAEHIACVDKRINRLGDIPAAHTKLVDWIQRDLLSHWQKIKSGITQDDVPVLPAQERCVSPSDFGFHNALKVGENFVFLDFEYAGWDDPAKLVCDFFSQPRIPVSIKYLETFMHTAQLDNPLLRRRVAALMPLIRIKWCCIMLNEFLPNDHTRRLLAHSNTISEQALDEQARRVFDYFKNRVLEV